MRSEVQTCILDQASGQVCGAVSKVCHLNKLFIKKMFRKQATCFDIPTMFVFCIYFHLVSKASWFLFLRVLNIGVLDLTIV